MSNNFRMTKARKAIIAVFEQTTSPLTAQELNSKIPVNKTTIYRELEFLLHQDLLTSVNFGDGKTRYEKVKDHHHHLICDTCGEIEDVKLDETKLLQSIKSNSFMVNRHNLEFFGLCQNCQ